MGPKKNPVHDVAGEQSDDGQEDGVRTDEIAEAGAGSRRLPTRPTGAGAARRKPEAPAAPGMAVPVKSGSKAVAMNAVGGYGEAFDDDCFASRSLPSHLGGLQQTQRMFGTSPVAHNLTLESGGVPLHVPRVPRDELYVVQDDTPRLGVSLTESMSGLAAQLGDSSRAFSDHPSPTSSQDSSHHSSQRVLNAGFPFGDGRITQGVTDLRDRVTPGSSSWDGSSRSVRIPKETRMPVRGQDVDSSRHDGNEREVKQGCFHPQRPMYKAMILFLQCMLTFGSFYCYDIPGALKSNFFKRFPSLTQLQYNLMYSLYSWPNTVQVFFGGYIIDKYVGVRWGCVICAVFGLVGQIMVTIGVQEKNLDLVLMGRFVFGMGGETLCVAQSAYVAKWFKGAELATAFGICLSFSRLGSAVNFDISPAVVNMEGPYGGFVAAEYWGVGATLLSLACVLLLNTMDYHADVVREREKKKEQRGRSISSVSKDDEPDEEVSLSDIWSFGLDVWIIFFICVSFYASVFVFLQNGVQFIRQRYDKTEQQAAFLMSLPYTISAVACPIFGYLVDRTGRALVWVFASTSLLGVLHFCFAFVKEFQPWVGVSMMGISYSVCAAALWPCIAIVVELHKLGTAYGLMTAFQNLGLAVFPLLIADMLPEDSATNTTDEFLVIYGPVMSVFAACGATGASLTAVLYFVDLRNNGWLNASAAALLQREEDEAKEEEEALLERERMSGENETEPLLPSMHLHVGHQRGRYLSRLGIRAAISVHGGPRPFTPKPLKKSILTPGWDYEKGLAHFQRRTEPANSFSQV